MDNGYGVFDSGDVLSDEHNVSFDESTMNRFAQNDELETWLSSYQTKVDHEAEACRQTWIRFPSKLIELIE